MSLSPSRVAASSLRVLPRKRLSRAIGQLASLSAPELVLSRAMQLYCRAYGVDMSDCEVPAEGFSSFDAFFTRKLRPGTRPIDADPRVLVSPADGKLEAAGSVDADAKLLVKGQEYSAAELLGDAEQARAFAGGQYGLVYLSPRDYHRVHTPVDGKVTQVQYVPGTLLPVTLPTNFGLPAAICAFAADETQASATKPPMAAAFLNMIVPLRSANYSVSVAWKAGVPSLETCRPYAAC